jgi:aminotransferase
MFYELTTLAQSAQQPALRAVTNRIESVGGVNMSQGKCPLPVHPIVKDACHRAINEGWNTATLRNGTPILREQLVTHYQRLRSVSFSPEEVSVTHGVTGALEVICRMFLNPGDEVVLFRPAFPYYEKMIRIRGAEPRFVELKGDEWAFDLAELSAAFTTKTKLIIFCTPSNPTGKVFQRAELEQIACLCQQHNVVCISDEVYENIVADGEKNLSIATFEGMRERTITLSSVSKTFFATGWRIGWAIGPADVMRIFSIHSDQLFLCANSVMQHACAYSFENLPDSYYTQLPIQFNRRQDQLRQVLEEKGFRCTNPQGGYFLMAFYGDYFKDDNDAVDQLIGTANVGVAPGYSFEPFENKKSGYLRFSCAIPDSEMDRGCSGLLLL